ncbi:unnamed protein product, partial [Cladocopium goreaui]
ASAVVFLALLSPAWTLVKVKALKNAQDTAQRKRDGSSDGSVDPFESDKLTAKASRMVPWHSLVSASRAGEEDLEPDAVPEAVPEADGYGF